MITYAQERLAVALSDVCAMLPAQHAHTGDPDLPPDPQWHIYSALEQVGRAALFVARDNDRAVGYAAAFVAPALNSKHVLVGQIPTWFVEEGAWRGVIAVSLLRTAVNWLLENGARKVDIDTEYGHSAGKLLERMGFIPVKVGYRLSAAPNRSARATQ